MNANDKKQVAGREAPGSSVQSSNEKNEMKVRVQIYSDRDGRIKVGIMTDDFIEERKMSQKAKLAAYNRFKKLF